MNGLRPYDEDARCPKCGHDKVRTSHHGEGGWKSRYSCPAVEQLRTSFPPEHLCRRCERCSYSWPEAILGQGGYDTPRRPDPAVAAVRP